MGQFSKGRYALMISDRSGAAFPYREMVQEWNGAWVHNSEYEPKQPQVSPRHTVQTHKLCNMQNLQEQNLQ